METEKIKELLRKKQLRATTNRVEVFAFVESQKHPIGIERLKQQFPKINGVTLYRMASDFVEQGLWDSCDLGHGHVDYESSNRPHHHHAVCKHCGDIEEVYGCEEVCKLTKNIAKHTKKFTSLQSTSSTIFGICHNCTSYDSAYTPKRSSRCT